jgi:hypothetical protein
MTSKIGSHAKTVEPARECLDDLRRRCAADRQGLR